MARSLATLTLGLCAAVAPMAAQDPVPPDRGCRWCSGYTVAIGVWLGPEEIGRGRNAGGGGEPLIAGLGDGVTGMVRGGVDRGAIGLDLAVDIGLERVDVRSDAGVDFPNHATWPVLWAVGVTVHPFFPVHRAGGRVRPFARVGGGGMLLSADFDNIKGQTLYHSWVWNAGGGLRVALSANRFVELTVRRYGVARNGPLHAFGATAVTLGLGGRG